MNLFIDLYTIQSFNFKLFYDLWAHTIIVQVPNLNAQFHLPMKYLLEKKTKLQLEIITIPYELSYPQNPTLERIHHG